MRAVFSRQFMLTPAQKSEAVRQLRAAYQQHLLIGVGQGFSPARQM